MEELDWFEEGLLTFGEEILLVLAGFLRFSCAVFSLGRINLIFGRIIVFYGRIIAGFGRIAMLLGKIQPPNNQPSVLFFNSKQKITSARALSFAKVIFKLIFV
ncbi:hypothetical protein [Alteribacter aurantiacus]|uniref:hypothetical protein n=1 Tax=Alteribacter aurantiacus TaxID=254410 RepID=UPI0004054176|nr:hypothetical protein [Alteribacter aurantiacus]